MKGVTGATDNEFGVMIISIHTPVKGVTLVVQVDGIHKFISIHTPVKGVTRSNRFVSRSSGFQSTHP